MSFIRKNTDVKKASALSTPLTPNTNAVGDKSVCNVFVETAPALEDSKMFSKVKWDKQIAICEHLKSQMSDMNRVFPLHLQNNDGRNVYRMVQPFTKMASVEDMVKTLKEHNLTMRANITRPRDAGPTHTCMEISTDHLEHLMSQSPDANGLKTLNVRALMDEKKEVARNGDMFLTIVESKEGPHAFTHIEYEIHDAHDKTLHATDTSYSF